MEMMSELLLKLNQFIVQKKALFSHLLALLLGLALADLAQIHFTQFLLSKTSSLSQKSKRKPPPSGDTSVTRKTTKTPLKVISRNLFNYEGFIPEPLAPKAL